jgi:hypothetical protein
MRQMMASLKSQAAAAESEGLPPEGVRSSDLRHAQLLATQGL